MGLRIQIRKRTKTTILAVFLLLFGAAAIGQTSDDKIAVLIVDGFSNHNWQQTTHVVKTLLEHSGLFKVSVSTAPVNSKSEIPDTWQPDFNNYKTVIINCNTIQNKDIHWPKAVQRHLEKYVSSGGGLYILHSANNAFSDWPEYNLMIGLGWRKPEEGVALQVNDDGSIKQIAIGKGQATYHGPRSDTVIRILNEHPINDGFPSAWITPDMELYKFARGPAENLTVLSYAQAAETNINWPVEWVVAYGNGRVYNSSMGHLWKDQTYPVSYRCKGFQTTLIRTTEWLATGHTTYPLPEDFPTEFEISLAKE